MGLNSAVVWVGLALGASPAPLPTGWTNWNDTTAGVKAAWPASPSVKQVPLIEGLESRLGWELTQGSTLWRLDVLTLKPDAFAGKSNDEVLQMARDGAQTMKAFEPIANRVLTVDGFPARRFHVQVERGPLMRHQIIWARPRLIHAVVIGPDEAVRGEMGQAFLDSVGVTGRIVIRGSGSL